MENVKRLIPGILFVYLISFISIFINDSIKHIVNLEALTIGIIIGILYNNLLETREIFKPGIKFSAKKLLKVGIILLGFKLNFKSLLNLGPKVILMIIIFVPSVLIIAYFLGKLFKMNNKIPILIGVGSSICGASAIVAMAPCINADEDDSVVAVSIINFLGAIGVLMYSAIALASGISDIEYGIWSGMSLQGVAHAIAAAFARGSEAGEIGTFVKMGRVVMLIPVAMVLSFIFNKKEKSSSVKFPMYIFYFIIAGIISSLGIIPNQLSMILVKLSSTFILMAMVGMGLSVDLKGIKDKGLKSFLFGLILFSLISITTNFIITKLI
ncbi:YeiH family protein [Caloranaerobacter ferrireducens]|uniref:YeiH family protein n=1 Tax=Caloranaerobacter ferrireducens TaxID=1323370 RepID=UPI00084DB913|nr:putative sulfate exporter family transporter [Caloranaerobacter ferrireducens]